MNENFKPSYLTPIFEEIIGLEKGMNKDATTKEQIEILYSKLPDLFIKEEVLEIKSVVEGGRVIKNNQINKDITDKFKKDFLIAIRWELPPRVYQIIEPILIKAYQDVIK